jgi:hypothetical protein
MISIARKGATIAARMLGGVVVLACWGGASPAQAPAVTLSPTVIAEAAAYQSYITRTAATSPAFKTGGEVAQALKQGASYDPQLLQRGAVAYAAVVALQDPNFVAGVRVFASDPGNRRAVVEDIHIDPAYVVGLKGSDSAAGLVIAALMGHAQGMVATGQSVKQAAYDVQHEAWSKESVVDRAQRLADAKATVSGLQLASADDAARLQQAANGAAPLGLTGQPVAPPYTPVVIHGMAIAALALLGQAGDADMAQITPLLDDQPSATCLNMAKLNLYQCLSVSKPHYEDIFCLGQHVLMDTGQCLAIAAGAPEPVIAPLPVSSTEVAYKAKPAAKKKHSKT